MSLDIAIDSVYRRNGAGEFLDTLASTPALIGSLITSLVSLVPERARPMWLQQRIIQIISHSVFILLFIYRRWPKYVFPRKLCWDINSHDTIVEKIKKLTNETKRINRLCDRATFNLSSILHKKQDLSESLRCQSCWLPLRPTVVLRFVPGIVRFRPAKMLAAAE